MLSSRLSPETIQATPGPVFGTGKYTQMMEIEWPRSDRPKNCTLNSLHSIATIKNKKQFVLISHSRGLIYPSRPNLKYAKILHCNKYENDQKKKEKFFLLFLFVTFRRVS